MGGIGRRLDRIEDLERKRATREVRAILAMMSDRAITVFFVADTPAEIAEAGLPHELLCPACAGDYTAMVGDEGAPP